MKAGFHRKSVNTANFNERKEIQDNDLSKKMSADLKTSLERDKLKWCCCCIPVKCGVHLIGLLVILALFQGLMLASYCMAISFVLTVGCLLFIIP